MDQIKPPKTRSSLIQPWPWPQICGPGYGAGGDSRLYMKVLSPDYARITAVDQIKPPKNRPSLIQSRPWPRICDGRGRAAASPQSIDRRFPAGMGGNSEFFPFFFLLRMEPMLVESGPVRESQPHSSHPTPSHPIPSHSTRVHPPIPCHPIPSNSIPPIPSHPIPRNPLHTTPTPSQAPRFPWYAGPVSSQRSGARWRCHCWLHGTADCGREDWMQRPASRPRDQLGRWRNISGRAMDCRIAEVCRLAPPPLPSFAPSIQLALSEACHLPCCRPPP